MPIFWTLVAIVGLLLAGSALYDSYFTTVTTVTTGASAPVGPAWYDFVLAQYGPMPLWAWIVLAVVVFLLLRQLPLGSFFTFSLPSTGSVAAQIGISFLVLATFFYLLSKVFPNAPLFTTSEGHMHIALYFLLSGLIALVAANLKGKAWFVNTALVVLMFAMIGHHTADLLDPSGKLSTKIASILSFGGTSAQQAASGTTPTCDGNVTVYTYEQGRTYIVNKNFCQVRAYVMQGCVNWYDATKRPIGGTCKGDPLPTVAGIVYMQPQSDAVVRLNRCRPNAPGVLVDSCA